ncbi:hypothetical protein INT43_008704 [Umbelopsis isabellina]|uniref:Uncharacterized protein n=1 Tax=Mortierella isabellina TaxID=91625 RepID=A0A8H7PVL2_MORIS|nr:hypothetical protein INT43_008704 [Umbelopsis isabellina]
MRQQQRGRQQSASILNNNKEQRMHNQVRNLMHNNSVPKPNRSRTNHNTDNSLSAGYVRDLEQCQEAELLDIKAKNLHILSNPCLTPTKNCSTIVATLPDQGEKLRATNNLIESILAKLSPNGSYHSSPPNIGQDNAAAQEENTDENPLMNAMSKLSIKSKENGRAHSVALANAEASNNQFISSGIMRTRKPSIADGAQLDSTSPDACVNARVQMITLNESVQLQETHQQTSKAQDLKYKLNRLKNSRSDYSLTEELTDTMQSMRLDPETDQSEPDDDDTTDSDVDESANDSPIEDYEDEGFEEDDEYIHSRQRNS